MNPVLSNTPVNNINNAGNVNRIPQIIPPNLAHMNPGYPGTFVPLMGPSGYPYPLNVPNVMGMPIYLQQQKFTAVPVIQPATAIPMNPDTTGYFGNLSPNLSEEVVTAILTCCGGFKRIKRPVDPSSGKPKPFALVEFESVSDLVRAFKLLQDFILDNRHLNIKLESGIKIEPGENDLSADLKVFEGINRVLIGKRVTGGGSMEWIEKRILQIKKETERVKEAAALAANEHGGPKDSRRDRQRNYSDLIDIEPSKYSTTKSSTSTSKDDALMSLKDRERRWELKSKDLEREFRRDLEKDTERGKRHEKEAACLAEQVSNYSDGLFVKFGNLNLKETLLSEAAIPSLEQSPSALFFSNREKWCKQRERAQEKEREIFGECQKILELSLTNKKAGKMKNESVEVKQRELLEKFVPVEREELFAFPVQWDQLKNFSNEFKEICRERTAAFFPEARKEICHKLADILIDRLPRDQPAKLIKELNNEPTFLGVSNESGEADLLILLIWRWLIYFTSAKSQNII